MSFVANRMALRVQPRPKSWHVALDPSAVRGAGRIEQARFWGLYVTGTVAAYLERRTAEDGRKTTTAVETVEALNSSRGGGRAGTVTNGEGDKTQGELRGSRWPRGTHREARSWQGPADLAPKAGRRAKGQGPGAEATLTAPSTTTPVGIPP